MGKHLLDHKWLLLIVILIQIWHYGKSEQCESILKCNQCTNNICEACFSFYGGEIGPRTLWKGNCFADRTNLIENCVVYSTTDFSTANTVCERCLPNYLLVMIEDSTQNYTYSCNEDLTGQTIENCEQTI